MVQFDNTKTCHYGCKHILTILCVVFLIYLDPATGDAMEDQSSLWQAAASGNTLVIMRHAIAPGTGDPQAFTIGECQTQRNLSEAGRRQARAIGDRFRAHGIEKARVFSSQWCRCLETAELLDLGVVEELMVLNSFFRNYERKESATRGLKQWIAAQELDQPTVLVTHQVNITALTQIYPASGEMVIVERLDNGELSVLGSIETE